MCVPGIVAYSPFGNGHTGRNISSFLSNILYFFFSGPAGLVLYKSPNMLLRHQFACSMINTATQKCSMSAKTAATASSKASTLAYQLFTLARPKHQLLPPTTATYCHTCCHTATEGVA
jgi:hypothetical protein